MWDRLGSDNPRFRGENIIQLGTKFTRFTSAKVQILTQKALLELDMPERTTRDYEERDLLSEVLNPKP